MTMKPWSLAIAAAIALGSASASARTDGEARLARMLEGRIAGTPIECLPDNIKIRRTTVEGTALVYRVGRTLYVNRPSHAEKLDVWDGFHSIRNRSRTCAGDLARGSQNRWPSATFNLGTLGKFVPYRRPD